MKKSEEVFERSRSVWKSQRQSPHRPEGGGAPGAAVTREEKVEALLSIDRDLYFDGVRAVVDDYEDVMRGNRKPYALMTDEELDAELKAAREDVPGFCGPEGGG